MRTAANPTGRPYTPPLVGEGDIEQLLKGVAERLLCYKEADPGFLRGFLERRQKCVGVMNGLVGGYLVMRDGVAGNVGEVVELGVKVLELYLEVLGLEGILEGFLGVGEVSLNFFFVFWVFLQVLML